MRSFVIHVSKAETLIVEVEYEKISAMEDPSVMWLPSSEFRAKIMKPSLLLDKQKDGTLLAPVYYSHAFFDSAEQAKVAAEKGLHEGLERKCRKAHCEPPTIEEIENEISKIKIVML